MGAHSSRSVPHSALHPQRLALRDLSSSRLVLGRILVFVSRPSSDLPLLNASFIPLPPLFELLYSGGGIPPSLLLLIVFVEALRLLLLFFACRALFHSISFWSRFAPCALSLFSFLFLFFTPNGPTYQTTPPLHTQLFTGVLPLPLLTAVLLFSLRELLTTLGRSLICLLSAFIVSVPSSPHSPVVAAISARGITRTSTRNFVIGVPP